MSTPAADDVATIRAKVEYERGFAAAIAGHKNEVPEGCMDTSAWRDGWREGDRLKPAAG